MAGRKNPRKSPSPDPWIEELRHGEARCFTNSARLLLESNIHLFRDGVVNSWPLRAPCGHQLGAYGWLSDMLLSGYAGHRTSNGEITLYRAIPEPGDADWPWS